MYRIIRVSIRKHGSISVSIETSNLFDERTKYAAQYNVARSDVRFTYEELIFQEQ